MLNFAYPLLWLLLPAPWMVHRLAPAMVLKRSSVRVPFLSRLPNADTSNHPPTGKAWLTTLGKAFVWTLVIGALARPQWVGAPVERIEPTRDLLLLVDLSGSMNQDDFQGADGNATTRLSALKQVIKDFLKNRQSDRVGLVVFGNSPFVQLPFTDDLELIDQLVDETDVGMAGPRTALGDAIGLGITLFEQSEAPEKTIIALTDGNDNASSVPATQAARVAAHQQITIHTIAMGDPETVGEEALDMMSLQQVSQTTGGQTFLAVNRSELVSAYSAIDQIETQELTKIGYRPRTDLYFWPLATALLLTIGRAAIGLRGQPVLNQSAAQSARLRVNSRTFKLEPVHAATSADQPEVNA